MSFRALFVDDDQMLLSSMERCLGLKFDMHTAVSGAAALEKMRAGMFFPVVVTDMRMPGMDGVEFIARAREVSPKSIYLMLTGNQDMQSAIRAVNEGQVFRFLNKPCDPKEIAASLEHAYRQHQLESAEDELLNETLVGVMGVFADVVETVCPDLSDWSGDLEQHLTALCSFCKITPLWEYQVASKLLPLGFAMQPETLLTEPASSKEPIALNHACSVAARIVERIPRLAAVAEIIRCVPSTDGALPDPGSRSEEDLTITGASLLRVAYLIESLTNRGIDAGEVRGRIEQSLPNASSELVGGAHAICLNIGEAVGVPVDVDELKPGMVLSDSITRSDGATLLRAGRLLSPTHIAKLQVEKQSRGSHDPVVVTQASYQEAYPEAAQLTPA